MPSNRRAFTLVELLVVIAIIGLLSTVAAISLNSARSKARDTKRIADIKQIITAMQLYYQDNGGYPDTVALGCSGTYFCLGHGTSGTCWLSGSYHGCDALDSAIAPYMAKIPDDPDIGNYNFAGDAYLYSSSAAVGSAQPPNLHWGMENGPTTANSCLGASYGAWVSGQYKDSRYWCAYTIRP